MRNKKKIITLLIAIVMVLSMVGTSIATGAQQVNDTPKTTNVKPDVLSIKGEQETEKTTDKTKETSAASKKTSTNTKQNRSATPNELSTDGEYLLIASASDLVTVMNDTAYWSKKLKLTGSIDMRGIVAKPIGSGSSSAFSGTFDGNGKTISNLTIDTSTNYIGLFGYNSGTIKNVTIADSKVFGDQYVGGLIGYNAGKVEGCAVKNSAVSSDCSQTMGYIGGFAGYSKGNILRSYVAKGSVTQNTANKGKAVGGFVGYCASPGKINECYTTTQVSSAGEQVGGFVGNGYGGTMENCFTAGNVIGLKYVGGFVGHEDSAKYVSCYTVASVVSSGAHNYFGKFFGDGFFMSSYVSKSFYLSGVSISGNGTEKNQGSYFQGKTTNELKALSGTLGPAWKADQGHNDGYPYLVNVKAPENSGSSSAPAELSVPSNLKWTDGIAYWDAVDRASSYTFKLYKDTDTLVDTYTNVTDTSMDFKTIITQTGDYHFIVQAIAEVGSTDYIDSKESSKSAVYQFVQRDEQGYVLISTPEELLALSKEGIDLTKNYKLAKDIDMAGQDGKVIGKYNNGASGEKVFTGVFEGDGHTIKNLSISGEGLFGYVGADGVIRNLTLESAVVEDTVNSSVRYPATLVSNNKGTVENCFSYGSTVTSKYNNSTGGLIGNNEGTVKQSGVSGGSVHYQGTGTMTGGLVGRNTGSISECFADTRVVGYKWVGGFVGGAQGGMITDCYATGMVNGNNELGGFAGMLADPAVLTNVYASNDVNAFANSGGALVGGKGFSFSTVGTVVNGYYNSDRQKPGSEIVFISAMAKTNAQMKKETFALALGGAWKADIAAGDVIINSGYPYLVNAAPIAKEPEAEFISVDMMIATWDNSAYKFVLKAVPLAVKAQGDNVTVEKVMQSARDCGQIEYTTSQNALGAFVKTINGKTLDSPSGWMFTINDRPSPLGISSAQVKSGNKILWYEGTVANGYKAPTCDQMTAPAPVQYESIATGEQLIRLMNSNNKSTDWAKNYKLIADIDLNKVDNLSPIGSEAVPFSGTFDGNGHDIKNMVIKKGVGSQNVGLFGVIEGASIFNLQVNNAVIEGGSKTGVLVGLARVNIAKGKTNLIGNCHVSGTLKATGTSVIKQTDAGGLIGINDGGSKDGKSAYSAIDGCTANVEVTASTGGADNTESGHVGGFVGWNKGNISYSEAGGNVYGGNTTGGFVGSNFGEANIYDSHTFGNVIGGYTTGGFAGSIGTGTSAKRCYTTGNVVAIEDSYGYYFGGFVGSASGTLKECVSTGTLTPGWSYNGGFAGSFEGTIWSYKDDLLTLQDCYGSGETSVGTKIKGLGNYIGGIHDATDNAAAKISLTRQQAADKLYEMLAAQAKAQADKTALKQEAAKYEEYITIPNTVKENTDVTSLIAKLKSGVTPDLNIDIMYREASENNYVTSAKEPLGKYKLLQKNTSFGAVTEQVVLLFTRGGETVAQPVTVEIQGVKSNSSADKIINTIAGDYKNLNYEYSSSDWAAFDMGVYMGADNAFISERAKVEFIKQSIASIRKNNATDFERVIMMMTALGKDAQQYVDTVAKLPEMQLDTVNAQAFALLAYDSGNYTLPSGTVNTREKAIAYLLSSKNADGGWSFMAGRSEASMTAIVISALAPYKDRADVSLAINGGLDCLSLMQTSNGGFAYEGLENSNDAAMVVVALTSLGIDAKTDPRFVKNGNSVYQNLLGFVTKDNRFGYTDNAHMNELSTEQGFRAMIAYSKLEATGYSIYKVSSQLQEWIKPVTGVDKNTGVSVDSDTYTVPKGTTIKAEEIKSGAGFELAQKALGKDTSKFVLYDIKLSDIDGKTIQPNGKVRIGIPIPEGFDKIRLIVYRINEDGTRVEYVVTIEGNMAYFETDHFSLYALAEKIETPFGGGKENGETIENITENESGMSSPATGDVQDIGGYIILMLIAAGIITYASLALYRKKHLDR